jgi:hypothetical protein
MLVMLLGIVMLGKLMHELNAKFPMLMTLSGIVTLLRLAQPKKADPAILVTL